MLTEEIKKFRGDYKGPKQVEELVGQYSGELENLGRVLTGKNAQEQKAALGLLVDKIEVKRSDGIARCYLYEMPNVWDTPLAFSGRVRGGTRIRTGE